MTVCAGIIDGGLRLWHHLDKGKWNGSVAAKGSIVESSPEAPWSEGQLPDPE